MRSNPDTQKVDIDTYFSDVDDHVKPVSPQDAPRPNPAQLSPQWLKQLIISPPNSEDQVLKPYRNQRAMLSEEREFSPLELEVAHGAVCRLRDGLRAQALGADIIPASLSLVPTSSKTVPQSPPTPKSRWVRRSLYTTATLTIAAMATHFAWPYVTTCQVETCYSTWFHPLGQAAQTVKQQIESSHSGRSSANAHNLDQHHFSEGLNYAYAASKLTQNAYASEEWLQIVHLWQLALNQLQLIPPTSDLYAQAQAREETYRQNLAYASQELETAPFRAGVRAAEEASHLAIAASTREEWQTVAEKWKTALMMMQAVPENSQQYPIAESKLVEYSTKFAYTQKRYLDSQSHQRP
jgi:hypothetical protein